MTKAIELAEWIEGDMSCQGDAEMAAELRRLAAVEQELADLKAAMGEPVADLTISDDDFDMGLTDDYAVGNKRLANGSYNLYAVKAKP